MASFALSDISKSVSQCKELPDNEMTALEFPGGIAYDHEALPKIVAVHTLIEVSPDKINAQDDSLIDTEVKKKRFAEVPLTDKTISKHGSRRWIIRSKPELPFSQITTTPKTPEEISQAQPLPSRSFNAFPTKKLFNFCDINHGYSYDDVYENKTTVPPSQELPTCTASRNTSAISKLMISKHLNENEKQKDTAAITPGKSDETEKEKATKLNEIVENEKKTLKSLKWDHSNHLGDSAGSLNLKQEGSPAEILTITSDAKGIPSVKFPGQSDKTAGVEENKKQEIMPSHATSLLPSEDSVTHCADRKEHCNETSKALESMITLCSDPKLTSKESKKTLGKTNDTPIVGKWSQKQKVNVSKKNLASSSLDSEQETSSSNNTAVQKKITKFRKTAFSTESTQSLKPPANHSSRSIAAEQSSSQKNSKNTKLSLRERVLERIKRLKDNTKSYKESPEAKNLEKYRKYRKLGFGVAESLNELSKNGEINPKLEVTKDGQVKKKESSEELLEEVVLMKKSRKDRKTLKTEFTTEHKNLDSKQNGTIKSKNGMKENEEVKNERNVKTEVNASMVCSPTASEPTLVHADEGDSNVIHSMGSNPIQGLENIPMKVKESDDVSTEQNLKEKEGLNWTEKIDDVIQTSTPEKGKSLNQCLDKLKTITSSVKRTLDSDEDNGLHANNPDSSSISKRPRKAVPRRLAKGRWPSYSDDDSISPDTSLTEEHPCGFNLTSSDVDNQSSSSSLSSPSDTKGQKTETTDEPLCDGRTLIGKSDLSPNEENLNMKNIDVDSIKISAQRDTDKLDTSPSIALPEQLVSESVTTTFDNGLVKTLPPTRLFTKDTLREQMEEAAWEPYWFSGEDDKRNVSNQCWVGVPYPTIPRENYTIKTSLDREERIKTLLAKQNQLLSKINSNVSGNSLS